MREGKPEAFLLISPAIAFTSTPACAAHRDRGDAGSSPTRVGTTPPPPPLPTCAPTPQPRTCMCSPSGPWKCRQ
eukprot:221582-Chlamydomonas_euryale.AAC.1